MSNPWLLPAAVNSGFCFGVAEDGCAAREAGAVSGPTTGFCWALQNLCNRNPFSLLCPFLQGNRSGSKKSGAGGEDEKFQKENVPLRLEMMHSQCWSPLALSGSLSGCGSPLLLVAMGRQELQTGQGMETHASPGHGRVRQGRKGKDFLSVRQYSKCYFSPSFSFPRDLSGWKTYGPLSLGCLIERIQYVICNEQQLCW